MKQFTRTLVSRRPVAAVLVLTLLFPASGFAQQQKPGSIGVNERAPADAPAEWSDLPAFTLNGANGWIAQRQSKPLDATKDGSAFTHERLVFLSPWGEKAEIEAVIVPDEASANGTMLVSFGNLEMEIVAGSEGFSSIAVSDGSKWVEDVASLRRKIDGPGAVAEEINLEPYEMIANELMTRFSPDFLAGLKANLSVEATTAPVLFGECMGEMGGCALNLALWGLSLVALTGCFASGLVPACIATIVGHTGAGAGVVSSCAMWIHCENGTDPCN